MTQKDSIADMNRIIAEFDGYEPYEDQSGIWFKREGLIKCMHPKLQDLRYHSDWNWLMPVVEKIEHDARVDIYGPACKISKAEWTEDIAVVNESKITAVYLAVIEFITRYNKTVKP